MISKRPGGSTTPKFLSTLAMSLALLFSMTALQAEESPKVDLNQAKAELAKSKKGEKEPRKRLFFRKKDSAEKAKAEKPPEPKKELEKKEVVKEEEKRRFRVFGRGSDDKKEVKAEAEESKPAKDEKKEGMKRFSPFGKRDRKDADEKKEVTPAPALKKEETEKVVKKAKSEEKRGFLGGMFKGGGSNDKKVAKAADKPEPVKKDDKKSGEASKGFKLFGSRGDSKEFAKAEKTKLGKSIESKPGKKSGGALTKKSSTGGELGWYVVTEAKAPFYAVGPGQPMPPEKKLDRGSMLTVTKGGWGWCNVKLGSGELGVVSSKAMRPATVAEVSRHTRPVATASKSTSSRKLFNFISRGPAPKLDLPQRVSDAPIRNFGLLPSVNLDLTE